MIMAAAAAVVVVAVQSGCLPFVANFGFVCVHLGANLVK
jgi:hypothetical protein